MGHASRDPWFDRTSVALESRREGLWVFRSGAARQRAVDRVDVVTGRRTPLFLIDEIQGIGTPFVAAVSVADDGRSYVYFTATYSSLLFSVEGMR